MNKELWYDIIVNLTCSLVAGYIIALATGQIVL